MRSLGAVGSTIHSMIKFPTNQRVVTMETSKETMRECKHLERVQGSWKEVQWRQPEEQTSMIREQAILRARSNSRRRPGSGPVSIEKTRNKEDIEEVFTISHECLDQYVTMGATLTTNCKQLMAGILRENIEVFAWTGSEREGLIRKVRRPEWITNAIPIKLANGTSKVQMDYSSLNKACSKDMYPFSEEGEELASLMGYPYKFFLRLSKEYNQIRMAEDDEEKTGFHTEEGVYCFTHMPKELKNSAATLQRMMEKVLAEKRTKRGNTLGGHSNKKQK
ncbi:hypothetical protein Tco_1421155 [Tanacetum coccineum]